MKPIVSDQRGSKAPSHNNSIYLSTRIQNTAIALGSLMTAGLIVIAFIESAGEVVSDVISPDLAWHYAAHFLVFALYAAVWTVAFPRMVPAYLLAALVGFGFFHEAIEIVGHHHPFEWIDAMTDGCGCAFGFLCLRSFALNLGQIIRKP